MSVEGRTEADSMYIEKLERDMKEEQQLRQTAAALAETAKERATEAEARATEAEKNHAVLQIYMREVMDKLAGVRSVIDGLLKQMETNLGAKSDIEE